MQRILISGDSRYPVNRKVVRQAITDTLFKNKISKDDVEVSVMVIGRRKMKELSRKFLKDDGLHEVLSFPLEDIAYENADITSARQGFVNYPDEVLRLGDIILSWPDVVAQASLDNVMVDYEVYKLTAHSCEHLLGKHHE